MNKKDHYLKIVEWSDEDQCYVGSIPGWIGKCCHGNNEKEVYRELCQILEEWIEIYEEDNIPLPSSIASKKFCGKILKKIILQPDISRANKKNQQAQEAAPLILGR
ncbi:MAG: type II toxin-antitoxin system HicB family antitoxin [Deltaproteobacteria bacterium]|nr:type II toxin-antitoxin system HicB family antitoxin [Deltaproteobacteria bacterium]